MFSYRIFKDIVPYFRGFKEVYLRSGISKLFDEYVSLMLFSTLTVFLIALGLGALLHFILFNLTLIQYIIAVFTFSSVLSLIVPITFMLYPFIQRSQRKKGIDDNLVYTIGYMSILSAGGLSIERIFDRVTYVEQQNPIKDLARRFITNIKMFGLDAVSSLDDIAHRSSSATFSKMISGISNTIKTSGDLRSILAFETRGLLHDKKENLKKILSTLTLLGEIYITVIVMGPIVFIVMLTILSIMGNTTFGLTPIEQLNLITFFGIPALSLIFIVILNSVVPEDK